MLNQKEYYIRLNSAKNLHNHLYSNNTVFEIGKYVQCDLAQQNASLI